MVICGVQKQCNHVDYFFVNMISQNSCHAECNFIRVIRVIRVRKRNLVEIHRLA